MQLNNTKFGSFNNFLDGYFLSKNAAPTGMILEAGRAPGESADRYCEVCVTLLFRTPKFEFQNQIFFFENLIKYEEFHIK